MTETPTNTRVTVEDGWAVRNLPNGDQVRARLIPDTMGDTEQPEWDAVTLVRERDSYGGMNLGEHDGLSAVLERTYAPANVHEHGTMTGVVRRESEEMPEFHWLKDGKLPIPREEFVRRYLRAFHGVEDAFLFHHRDHSDWADIWVITEVQEIPELGAWAPTREAAEAHVQEWSDWASGDCYGFESQTRTLRDALEHGEFGWKDADTCWGYIGDAGARYALSEALNVDEDQVPAPYEVISY